MNLQRHKVLVFTDKHWLNVGNVKQAGFSLNWKRCATCFPSKRQEMNVVNSQVTCAISLKCRPWVVEDIGRWEIQIRKHQAHSTAIERHYMVYRLHN